MRRPLLIAVVVIAALGILYVVDQAFRTLQTLDVVERDRDTWQRPDAILDALELRPGQTVVDFGSGAGYFALKLAPRVGPTGRVLALDLRRQSLAFLWIRARRSGYRQLQVVRNQPDDPALPPGQADAVLLANTYHELESPDAILASLFRALRPGGRLVVVDRRSRDPAAPATGEHGIPPAAVERQLLAHGFERVSLDEQFINRPSDDDIWWLLVVRRP